MVRLVLNGLEALETGNGGGGVLQLSKKYTASEIKWQSPSIICLI